MTERYYIDEYFSNWYSQLDPEEKAEIDAISDMYDEYEFVMECEL